VIVWSPAKAQKLRDLSVRAYVAAKTPAEAKMASILLTLFAPDKEREAHGGVA
jgi:hypothetical protein